MENVSAIGHIPHYGHHLPWSAMVAVACNRYLLSKQYSRTPQGAGLSVAKRGDSLSKRRGTMVLKTLEGLEDGNGSVPASVVRRVGADRDLAAGGGQARWDGVAARAVVVDDQS